MAHWFGLLQMQQDDDVTGTLAFPELYIGESNICVRNSNFSSAFQAIHGVSANAYTLGMRRLGTLELRSHGAVTRAYSQAYREY